MFQRLRSYIEPKEFEFQYSFSKIYFNNYDEICTLTDSIVDIKYQDHHFITIKGENLSIKKLLDKELLLQGKIKDIHFYDA